MRVELHTFHKSSFAITSEHKWDSVSNNRPSSSILRIEWSRFPRKPVQVGYERRVKAFLTDRNKIRSISFISDLQISNFTKYFGNATCGLIQIHHHCAFISHTLCERSRGWRHVFRAVATKPLTPSTEITLRSVRVASR
jgi:hypothetical protein